MNQPATATSDKGFFGDAFSGMLKFLGLESGGYDSFVQLLFGWIIAYVIAVFLFGRLSLKPTLLKVGGTKLVNAVASETTFGSLYIGRVSGNAKASGNGNGNGLGGSSSAVSLV